MNTQVTRDSLQAMLDNKNPNYVMAVVGRALVRIFERQTADEKRSDSTKEHNNIGFAGCDAESGSKTAKYYIKHKRLEQWMIDRWVKKSERTGYSRLTKYHRQLNEIAQQGK